MLGAGKEFDRITALGQLIALRKFVVTESCSRTYEAIKQYQWRDLTTAERMRGEDPKESPLKKNTHLVECAQFLAGRWVAPKPLEPTYEDDRYQLSAEIWKGVKAQQRRGRPAGYNDLGGIV